MAQLATIGRKHIVITFIDALSRRGILLLTEIDMRATLRKMGNSQGVIIPKTLITQLGFEGEVEMRVTETGILLEKPQKSHPREGWIEASQGLLDEELDSDWLGFGNADDKDLKW